MAETSVCKLPLTGNIDSALLKTRWLESNLNITLVEKENAYRGYLNEDQINEIIKKLGISAEDYICQCKDALSTNGGHKDFVYVLKNHEFQWKKNHSDMRIIFGRITLNSVPIKDALNDIIDVSINENWNMKERLIKLEQEKYLLENGNKELLREIENIITIKNEMENELYSLFLVMLNTKKRRISNLEKQLKLNGLEVLNDQDLQEIMDGTEEDEKKKLYECDTEVETGESDQERNEIIVQDKSTKKEKNDEFDSDSDTEISKMLPKRNRISTDIGNTIDGSETNFSLSSSNIFKNQIKRSHEKNLKYSDEEAGPGPSGVKISKFSEGNVNINKIDINISGCNVAGLKNWRSSFDDIKNNSFKIKENNESPPESPYKEGISVKLNENEYNEPENVDDFLSKLIG